MSSMSQPSSGRPATIENLESRLLASTARSSATPLENLALAFRGRGGEIEFNALLHYAQSLAKAHNAAAHPITQPKPTPKPVAQPKPILHAPAPSRYPRPTRLRPIWP